MAELSINKTATGYESEVVVDKIEAIEIVFDDEQTDQANTIQVAISVDGETFVSNRTITIAERAFCMVVGDDVDGLSKKIITNNKPKNISVL